MSTAVNGDAYEGLLENDTKDTKSSAVQYFKPRPLIAAMAQAVSPQPSEASSDSARSTGEFLPAAHDYLVSRNPNLTKDRKKQLKVRTFMGIELVQSVERLCAMNLLLHGIGSQETEPIEVTDLLAGMYEPQMTMLKRIP